MMFIDRLKDNLNQQAALVKKGTRVLSLWCILVIMISTIFTKQVQAAMLAKPIKLAEKKIVRILAIEIDPILKKYGKKAADYLHERGDLDFTFSTALQRNIENFEAASNDTIDIQVVGIQYLNEYPKYTKKFTRAHRDDKNHWIKEGKFDRLDEASFLDLMGTSWYDWEASENPAVKEGIGETGIFDYEDLLNRLSLVERKNKNEFDMVWVFGVDPLNMNESTMIGRTAYWVNGEPIEKPCDNFIIFGFTIACACFGIENFGHMAECVLNSVFDVSDERYNTRFSSIDDLNLWEQFILCKKNSPKDNLIYGVGQVHFSPNSIEDYDWYNNTPVLSTWYDWKNNYPYLTGESRIFTDALYRDIPEGLSDSECHQRWWFQLMPHVTKRTKDGYSNNWWDYLIGLDYVAKIMKSPRQKDNTLHVYVGKTIAKLEVTLVYQSGKEKEYILNAQDGCITIADPSIAYMRQQGITGLRAGTTELNVWMDGKEYSFKLCVHEMKGRIQKQITSRYRWENAAICKE